MRAWALVTICGGLIGWAIWRLLLTARGDRVTGEWLDSQALAETKGGEIYGGTWWTKSEKEAAATARRRRWVQEMREARLKRKERAS